MHGTLYESFKYFGAFLLVPHYLLFLWKYVQTMSRENWIVFSKSFGLFCTIISFLSLFSIFMSFDQISFIHQLLTYNFWVHSSPYFRTDLLYAMAFPDHLLSLSTGKAIVSLTSLYCVLNILFLVLVGEWKRMQVISAFLSTVVIMLVHSRSQLLSIILLFLALNRLHWVTIIFAFLSPFIQFFLPVDYLSGREHINSVFLKSFSLLGNGIGDTVVKAQAMFMKNESIDSFHSAHLELIHNFGFLIYLVIILVAFYGLKKLPIKTIAIFLIVTNVLQGMNYNLLNIYTPLAVAFIISAREFYVLQKEPRTSLLRSRLVIWLSRRIS
jgi:hypothetical protein